MAGYSQITIAQLRTAFYQQVGGNTSFFRQDEVDRYLRESFRVFNVLSGFWRDTITMPTTVAGQTWYTVPTTLSYILRVEVANHPLDPATLWDLDNAQPTWEGEIATSSDLPQMWAPAGTNLFALWPASFAGGETLVVEGVVPAPDPVTAPFVNLGKDELTAILDYAEHIAQFKEGGQEFEASQLSLQSFLKAAGERNATLRQSSRWRAFMGVSDRPKRPIRTQNDQVGVR